jgi:membrane peptidoglycan carboxypeptidase
MVLGGGSTITQQLIKNLTKNDALTFNRKIAEATLAIGLTQHYPKWKIMEMYFNVAPFGSMDLGVEAAIEEYFHLLPSCNQDFKCTPGIAQLDLNQQTRQHNPLLALARASLLAGMPQKPVTGNPTIDDAHKQRALARQVNVLNQMITLNMSVAGLGHITSAIAHQAEILTSWTGLSIKSKRLWAMEILTRELFPLSLVVLISARLSMSTWKIMWNRPYNAI